ncbi:radical SAM [Treponema primitia ZAS-2]|uniref:Radical SAM n=1 Tax=Treponema primitia (strain ATCC BAA-887 / DSM 12427 / ZAS-2) TaxID=545694 RepID=F5YQF6_TREPZ|nr:[FeFe] hydrogenase H-cluster radical SAM maturase HydE [Treponema primitia]AEF86723.1 radical SAM [Treponema primitia ZAS-2]
MNMVDLSGDAEILHYITTDDPAEAESLYAAAREVREEHYGQDVYFRGLIEFTNYCKNDCYYCGIRRSNSNAERYHLSMEQILYCCQMGDMLGYRSFVLQGGEDPWFTDDRITEMVEAIRREYPEHAITLSIGERKRESYERFFQAGANRYLLRHETANDEHYGKLHPAVMSLAERKDCLFALRDIGYQVGAGFMVGTPYQTPECLLEDLRFLEKLDPHMVGIGPFIPQAATPFGACPGGTLEQTLRMLALTRLLLPKTLLPATTALGTIDPRGRELGLMAGANVVMPNLSPKAVRKLYALYDNKICTGDEAAECRFCMEGRIRDYGFVPDMGRGDSRVEIGVPASV